MSGFVFCAEEGFIILSFVIIAALIVLSVQCWRLKGQRARLEYERDNALAEVEALEHEVSVTSTDTDHWQRWDVVVANAIQNQEGTGRRVEWGKDFNDYADRFLASHILAEIKLK